MDRNSPLSAFGFSEGDCLWTPLERPERPPLSILGPIEEKIMLDILLAVLGGLALAGIITFAVFCWLVAQAHHHK